MARTWGRARAVAKLTHSSCGQGRACVCARTVSLVRVGEGSAQRPPTRRTRCRVCRTVPSPFPSHLLQRCTLWVVLYAEGGAAWCVCGVPHLAFLPPLLLAQEQGWGLGGRRASLWGQAREEGGVCDGRPSLMAAGCIRLVGRLVAGRWAGVGERALCVCVRAAGAAVPACGRV